MEHGTTERKVIKTASVAMAVCNGERYLPQQLDSILGQLGDSDELVISYDKSQDATLDIARSYASIDDRVRIVSNCRHGIVGNFNNAIAACSKDSVFISDQDDVWIDGKRDRMIAALNESGADLVVHDMVHIDKEGRIVSAPLFKEYNIQKGLIRNFAAPRYSGCCMAFPLETYRLIMPMPESVVNYDHWIGMCCELFGDVAFLDDVLLMHRLHGANATTARRPLSVIAIQRINLLIELIKKARLLSSTSIGEERK